MLLDNVQNQRDGFTQSRNSSIGNFNSLERKGNSGNRSNLSSRQSNNATQRMSKLKLLSGEKPSRMPKQFETFAYDDQLDRKKAFKSI